MNERGQALRANYALKWFAIRKCREWGISRYDMNGLLNDGISNFKRGFANHDDMLAGTYDYPLSPLYSIWAGLLPIAKKIIRRIKH
jgi:peptidoglycan pentaglycine glycine transferase (the first glycine)